MGSTAPAWTRCDLKEIEANYVDERSSRWMYASLAARDRQPEWADLLRELAAFEGILTSVAVTGLALFLAGVIRALSTLHPFLRSEIEMVLIGMGAAAATYLVGIVLGVIVG